MAFLQVRMVILPKFWRRIIDANWKIDESLKLTSSYYLELLLCSNIALYKVFNSRGESLTLYWLLSPAPRMYSNLVIHILPHFGTRLYTKMFVLKFSTWLRFSLTVLSLSLLFWCLALAPWSGEDSAFSLNNSPEWYSTIIGEANRKIRIQKFDLLVVSSLVQGLSEYLLGFILSGIETSTRVRRTLWYYRLNLM